MKTIVAISTPLGKGAIAIVRMSGDKALEIATKVFSCNEKIEPRKMILGSFKIKEVKEKCLMVYFKAPFSYTGEDVVEFQIHGGVTIARLVEQELIDNGCVLAENGEFSRRAFENGKISLDEAESIVDEINSESLSELKASLSTTSGALKEKVSSLQDMLTNLLAEIEVSMDYPDEDENEDVRLKINDVLNDLHSKLENLLKNENEARYIRNGVSVALVGRANAGKSSLLNAMIGQNKAIVTDIEGTTRDIVEASVDINGVRFNLFDTAGLRESQNEIEKIGISKSKKVLLESDIVLLVLDGEKTGLNEFEKQILPKANIIVVNKCDKTRLLPKQKNEMEISALTGKNIENLKEKLFKTVIHNKIDFNEMLIVNERQLNHLKNAKEQIEKIFEVKNESLEILSMLIKSVWNELGKITGQTENEDIISLIFSKFCVGK